MKWFRSNIRLLSQLALFALAVQFPLSFGHFHGSAPAWADAKQSGFHNAVSFAATHLDASDGASHADASHPVRLKTPADHETDGQPTDKCATCAVMALTHALVVAAPPYLLGPQTAAFLYLTTDAEFVHLNCARVAFQPRAPPIS
jgi:hypothetical protein